MDETANRICRDLPEGWEITLTMEAGAAWVELFDDEGHIVDLPERDDRTLEWQINEALRIAHEVPNVELTGSPKRSFGESSDRRERG